MLVLHPSAGECPAAAEELRRFLDEQSLGVLRRYLESNGVPSADARERSAVIDALVRGVSTSCRVLRSGLGDRDELERWLGKAVQRPAPGD